MRDHHLLYAIIALGLTYSLHYQAQAAPAGPLIKHLSSLLKWTTRSASKTPHSDGNVLQFENGLVVETVVEGDEIGVIPDRIRVSEDGELFAVDSINSNIVRITPPLSQYSRGRLVAGSFQGHTGHVDGKPSDARFNHPKGITMDDRGNVYVADTENLAIRKIGDAGVTTIAGGKSNVAGYRDGPSEDAKFSNDLDVVYLRPTCSLLVIDRGNAALRQISLNQEDCDYQYSSISTTDILSVVGAIIVGYVTCMLQQGFGSSVFSRTQPSEREFNGQVSSVKPMPILESSKEEPGWPSFGQLMGDLSKISLEALVSGFFQFMPSHFRSDSPKRGLTPMKDCLQMPEDEVQPPFRSDGPKRGLTSLKGRLRMPEDEVQPPFRSDGPKRGLTPLKDHLRMPEDEVQPRLVERQSAAAPLTENRHVHTPSTAEKYSEMKPPKIKSSSFKDPSLSSKHRSSKRQEYAEFYGSSELPPYIKPKSQKERSRHRHREKSGEVVSCSVGAEQKHFETKAADYGNPKFNYNMRTKYVADDTFRFNSQ